MRALAFFALASIASGTLVFLACSSDTPDSPTGSSSSSSGKPTSSGNTTSSSGNGGGDGGAVVPEGGTLSGDGTCIVWCSPYLKATKIETLQRPDKPGAIKWTNPEGAATQDTSLATVTLAEGQESEYLSVTGFDFSDITDAKQTWGLQVELTRQSDDGGVEDAFIEVIVDGQQDKVRKKVLDGSWPRLKIGTHHYGQAVDTWGVDLNPVDVRKPTFGARIAAKRLEGITSAPVVATVDSLKVSVCYCKPGDLSGTPPE